jgi:hypothetical protein
MNELKMFFEELKDCYVKEKQSFNWEWEQIAKPTAVIANPPYKSIESCREFVYYIAYNLGKNILHGPLPSHLHSRMILENSKWGKKYCEFLEGK